MYFIDHVTAYPRHFNHLLRYCLRHYSGVSRHQNWSNVFDPRLQKQTAIKRFKDNLFKIVERNSVPVQDTPELEVLKCLAEKTNIDIKAGEIPIKRIYNLIVQRRIRDDEIYAVIQTLRQKNVINVSIPKKCLKIETKKQDQEDYKPFLEIHPETVNHLGSVLRNIKGQENFEIAKKETIDTFANESTLKNLSNNRNINIDIHSLKNYLKRTEMETKQRKKYVWENQRLYNWDQRLENSQKLSPGQLLFAKELNKNKRRKRQSLIKRFFRDCSIDTSSMLENEPKELLIYNLDDQSKYFIPSGNDNSIFNINYRDLFGVINSTGYIPEETVPIIGKFEVDGWKLIGNLYNNSKSLVFQRAHTEKKSSQMSKFISIKRMTLISLLVFLTYYTVRYFTVKSSDKDSNVGDDI